jgi:hypothetical protein
MDERSPLARVADARRLGTVTQRRLPSGALLEVAGRVAVVLDTAGSPRVFDAPAATQACRHQVYSVSRVGREYRLTPVGDASPSCPCRRVGSLLEAWL